MEFLIQFKYCVFPREVELHMAHREFTEMEEFLNLGQDLKNESIMIKSVTPLFDSRQDSSLQAPNFSRFHALVNRRFKKESRITWRNSVKLMLKLNG